MKPQYIKIGWESTKRYYSNKRMTILHREDGPAVEHFTGWTHWYKNGKLHREDGPAVEYRDGTKFWYKRDKLHREDGPAAEYEDGTKEYFLDGKEYSEKEFDARMNPAVELTLEDIAAKFGVDVKNLKIKK